MLRIYLPSSMDLKLCADLPTVDFVNTWTFVTIFTSRHLGPNIWVLASDICVVRFFINQYGCYCFKKSHTYEAIWSFWQKNCDKQAVVTLNGVSRPATAAGAAGGPLWRAAGPFELRSVIQRILVVNSTKIWVKSQKNTNTWLDLPFF